MELFKKHSITLIFLLLIINTFTSTAYSQNSNLKYIPGELIIKVKDSALSRSSGSVNKMSLAKSNSWMSDLGVINSSPLFSKISKSMGKLSFAKQSPLEKFYKVNVQTNETLQALINKFNNHPDIEFAEPNYIYTKQATTNDPDLNKLWGFNNTGQTGGNIDSDIDLFEAWDIETGSSSTIVAVIDTGVDYNHEDLADNIWVNTNEIPNNGIDDDENGYVDDYYGWDFAANDNDPMDGDTHGTHVSGTIGGVANNGIGVAGVAWNVQIMSIRFLGDGGGTTTEAVEAIKYAVDNGAKIINASWGGPGASQAIKEAIEYAKDHDVLFVAAAGNGDTLGNGIDNDDDSGTLWNPSEANFPSSHDSENILAVAATNDNDRITSFSNYGLTTVDVAAPGYNILSSTPDNQYDSYNGTSMATPIVAGLASLIYSQDPTLSALEIKQRILDTVDPIDNLLGKMVTGGRVNAYAALNTNDKPSISVNTSVEGNQVTFTGNIIDNDGYIATASISLSGLYKEWAQVINLELDNNGNFSTTVENLDDDGYRYTVSASDEKGATSESKGIVLVGDVPNTPPSVTINEAISDKSGCISVSGTADETDPFDFITGIRVNILGMQPILTAADENGNWQANKCGLIPGQYKVNAVASDSIGAQSTKTMLHIIEVLSENTVTDTLPAHVEAGRVKKYLYFSLTEEYRSLREKYCTKNGYFYDCDGEDHEFTLYRCEGLSQWTDNASECGQATPTVDIELSTSTNFAEVIKGQSTELNLNITNNGSSETSAVYIEAFELALDTCQALDCIQPDIGAAQIIKLIPTQGTCELVSDFLFNCSLGNLESGASATISLQLIATKTGAIYTDIIASSAQEDNDSSNNSASIQIDIISESSQENDNDGDGIEDSIDPDDDNDGIADDEDAFPLDPTESADNDNDGIGNNADTDDDNDGVEDTADAFPNDPTESKDSDEDGTGDNADAFPQDPTETKDSDEDGTGDNADAFPQDPTETKDSDEDGTGDNADAFPQDPTETKDSDEDGTGDNADAFPQDPTETKDSDEDGIGDNADAFPQDPTETKDSDEDGTGDNADAFPQDPTETKDSDEDGTGDNADAFPQDPTETKDSDEDGTGDNADAFPLNPSETKDTDGDGVGDNTDKYPTDPTKWSDEQNNTDSDGDGVADENDAFPNDPTETKDSDEDGVGDNADAFPHDPTETIDSDEDGVGDNTDAFPQDPTEIADSDEDGTGDNADAFPQDPTETSDSDGDGVGDNADAYPEDPTKWEPDTGKQTGDDTGGGGGGSTGLILLALLGLGLTTRKRK